MEFWPQAIRAESFVKSQSDGRHDLIVESVSHLPPKALVLFDIDGTLLRRAGPHHREALAAAVKKVTGIVTTTDGVPVAGMLDRDILTAMLAAKALPLRSYAGRCRRSSTTRSAPTCGRVPICAARFAPRARLLLYKLWRRGIPAGLVTGNLTRIGWTKMERAGLRRYLRFGAFAEMAHDRAGLVGIALRHARREGWIDRASPVALIGDHPNDIRAAKANGVRSVAVGNRADRRNGTGATFARHLSSGHALSLD